MAAPIVRVAGAARLRATMRAAGLKLKDLTAVNKRTAQMVSTVAAPKAPRRTGALAATTRPAGTQTAALVRAGSKAVPYGPPIHFGWPGHNIAPQPWIFDAAVTTEPEWTGFYHEEINKILDGIKGV